MNIFSSIFTICTHSLVKCLYVFLCQFSNWAVFLSLFLVLSFWELFIYSNLLSYVWFTNVFFHSVAWLFYILLTRAFFTGQNFYLMKSSLSIFPFMGDDFDVKSKTLPSPRFWWFRLRFFLKVLEFYILYENEWSMLSLFFYKVWDFSWGLFIHLFIFGLYMASHSSTICCKGYFFFLHWISLHLCQI